MDKVQSIALIKVCGLDLSLRGTGICVLGDDQLYTAQIGATVNYKVEGVEKDKVERLIYISEKILELCNYFNVDVVGMEGYSFGSFGGSSAVSGLAELAGAVKVKLFTDRKQVARLYSPKTARAIVFGKGRGNWKKDKVLAELVNRGLNFKTNDESDAFVIAAATLMESNKQLDFWPWLKEREFKNDSRDK